MDEMDRTTDEIHNKPNDKGIGALARDICSVEQYQKTIQTLIARRVYDFVCHAVDNLDILHNRDYIEWRMENGHSVNRIVEDDISDMTEWPDEE
jgi:hypothetical protein